MTKRKELDWLAIGKQIADTLKRRYVWIERNELMGVALLGVAKASRMYVKKHPESTLKGWILWKGYRLAVDELRTTGTIARPGRARRPTVFQGSALCDNEGDTMPGRVRRSTVFQGSALCDNEGDMMLFAEQYCMGVAQEQYVPTSCREWLRGLTAGETRIMIWRFDENMSFREIGELIDRTESVAYCIVKGALAKLRRWRREEFEAGERSRPGVV